MTKQDLMNDPEFRKWYNERPEVVRRAIDATDPTIPYDINKSSSDKWAYFIHGYDEQEDGTVTLQMMKKYKPEFPLPEYIVFGVEISELRPKTNWS